MSASKWTRGPWIFSYSAFLDGYAVRAEEDKGAFELVALCSAVNRAADARARHNVKLIAAAPELFEALEALKADCGDLHASKSVLARVKAALAKARGEVQP